MLLLREGHKAAFEEIVGRYQQPLTAFAAAIVPFHRAEDVVQASLLKAHDALLADDREVSLRAWLFTIVRNGALNVVRDDPSWAELDPSYDGVPQPAAIAEQNEELQTLVTAICALPAAQRRALVGRELNGEGHGAIAAELGTTKTAVRGLIFRARTTLRDGMGLALPLPLLRLLLVDAPAIGAAGVGAGAAAIGGGAKLAAAVSATAMVLGAGVAIDRVGDGHSGRAGAAQGRSGAEGRTPLADGAVQRQASASTAVGGSSSRSQTQSEPSGSGGGAGGEDRGSSGPGSGGGESPDRDGGERGEGGGGPGSGDKGSGGEGDSGSGKDGSSGSGQERPDDDDNSGPGSEDHDNSGPGSEDHEDDDNSGPGGGGGEEDSSDDSDDNGNSGSGSDHSGPGSGKEGAEEPEPEEPPDD